MVEAHAAWRHCRCYVSHLLRLVGIGSTGAGPSVPGGSAGTVWPTNGPRKMPFGLAAKVWNSCGKRSTTTGQIQLMLGTLVFGTLSECHETRALASSPRNAALLHEQAAMHSP